LKILFSEMFTDTAEIHVRAYWHGM